ncbi:Peptidase M23 [uncultured Caudovirales phage]|uniref:Peptidase M23 n=1 Tax=uncultured Caudovirales phage TaxID=2100421 RepID=A0A6J5L2G9_9CAUD|nr:Peptidase M23 [uncultured Caudovirales phage]CAB5219771.1 Peptidase M23 [uncultured Caudovirales phage]
MYNWRQPVDKVKLGSKFGVVDQWHKAPGHRGTDYNGFASGAALKAVGDGKVVLNQWSDVLGNVVVLQIGKWYFGYCHMLEKSPLKIGAKIASGAVVGKAGNTGSASAGTHLHFTLSLDKQGVFYGKVYDAYTFIEKMKKSEAAAAKAAAKAPAPVEAPVAPAASTAKASTKGAPLA